MESEKKKGEVVRRVLIVFLIGVICVSAFFLYKYMSRYRKGEKLYSRITDDYVLDDGDDEEESSDSPSETAEETGDEKAKVIVPPQIDHAGLLSENEDYIGWLRIRKCGIDLPIVLGESDSEYIHTGFNHEYIYQGTLFAEWRNRADFSDPNTIIYGHNMKNQSMFSNLGEYLDEDFALDNSTFWVSTKDYGYLYRVYSVAIVDEEGEAYTLFQSFDDAYHSYVTSRTEASLVDMGVTPDQDARTLTLSTCYGTGSDGKRLIVQAYREGVYPDEGCTKAQAKQNEQDLREKENVERVGYEVPAGE